MNIPLLNALRATLALVAAAVLSAAAQNQQPAQDAAGGYPTKPVRVIVGSSPGGGTDITARIVGERLGAKWRKSVVVENRSAGAIFGLEATSRATPDGYTLGLGASTGYVQAVLSIRLPFNLRTALEPIIQFTSQPYLLVVNPSLPVNSVGELIALVKSKPGSFNYASTGIGSDAHVGMELLRSMTGMNIVHIPYKGAGPALTDLIGGQVQLFFPSAISGVPHVKSGKLRALAVTSDKRSKLFPELPTIAEAGVPGFELRGWFGLIAPAGIAPAIAAKIFRDAAEVLARADVQERFAAVGAEVVTPSVPGDFRNTINHEIEKWEKFSKESGVKLD
jgi:tripartite-type tricarboxylate transporter receptor subunit TctC